ncbi:MAG: hypothetical protein K2N50_03730 [Clostridia bacterium]|nr:hypothetical protein [Clostridia bacterium]
MKASKGLIKAVIAFVASVVLCVGVCFAWFVQNNNVDANGLNPGIKAPNIKAFTVTAFSLYDKTTKTTGGQSVTTYEIGPAVSGNSVLMAPYGNMENEETALLLEFKYVFAEDLGKNYGIFAHLQRLIGEGTVQEVDDTESTEYDFKCDLSSAIGFYGATVSGTTVTREDNISGEDAKLICLNGGAATDGTVNTELVFYCIIDYVESEIDLLYRKAGDMGGDIWSQMRFDNDIDFYMQEFGKA